MNLINQDSLGIPSIIADFADCAEDNFILIIFHYHRFSPSDFLNFGEILKR